MMARTSAAVGLALAVALAAMAATAQEKGGSGRVSKLSTPKYLYEAELTSGEIEVNADGTVIKAP